jgi:hypothetical protein
MSTTTASVTDRPTTALDTDALILQHYAEIARYAVQLAVDKLSTVPSSASDRHLQSSCNVCLNVGNKHINHDDSCPVGRIFRLAARIAALKAAASERVIEYPTVVTADGTTLPARTTTPEQVARERAVTA